MSATAALTPGRDIHPPELAVVQPARKRRRRTATSAATDDCFACRKRAVACDRKRPYCTQCIDIGKECSGYKTTLTWGVGVASRGKLRGLSCPVAQKSTNAAPTAVAARRRKSSVHHRQDSEATNDAVAKLKPQGHTTSQSSSSSLPPPLPPATLPSAPHPVTYVPSTPISIAPSSQQVWPVAHLQTANQPVQPDRRASFHGSAPQRLQTAFPVHFEGRAVPQSAVSMASFADSDFNSPLEYPHTPGSMSYGERMLPPHSGPYAQPPLIGSPGGSLSLHSASIDSFSDAMSSSIDTIQTTGPPFSDQVTSPHDTGFQAFGSGMLDHGSMLISPFEHSQLINYDTFNHAADDFEEQDVDQQPKGFDLTDSRFSSPFFNISPRMQSLLDYYDQNICPWIVAFDGPENPYRKHVLQLAIHNEGLQNAIAALATNNFRMRQQAPPRQLGFVEELPDGFDAPYANAASQPSQEESYYKQMSIDQLNMQLIDARAAQDDSVLATLLVLCLFHVCDSGFSKFRTQLAGVQKLLTLRGPAGQSDFTRWVEMFFIWFDVMTSTVNDREMQIKPESLDMLDFSANLGALEQFSGCDGRLFKLIARLGRLNLLAQGRPVRRQDSLNSGPKTFQHDASMLHAPLTARDFRNVDGNGWGSRMMADEDHANSGGDKYPFVHPSMPVPDNRQDFWLEWHDIRSRLQTWEMDPTAASASLPLASPHAESGQRDLVHINESFRYSALLYTERLGHPLLPSAHHNFQQHVERALFHITSLPVTSCVNKFLLWPLFLTGTECVSPQHRAIVRSRCIEIQKESGFFNNLSSLEVLERVWYDNGGSSSNSSSYGSDNDSSNSSCHVAGTNVGNAAEIKARRRDSEAARTGLYGPALRWRKVMDRVDGEYIII